VKRAILLVLGAAGCDGPDLAAHQITLVDPVTTFTEVQGGLEIHGTVTVDVLVATDRGGHEGETTLVYVNRLLLGTGGVRNFAGTPVADVRAGEALPAAVVVGAEHGIAVEWSDTRPIAAGDLQLQSLGAEVYVELGDDLSLTVVQLSTGTIDPAP
jgi:hypothetical protein